MTSFSLLYLECRRAVNVTTRFVRTPKYWIPFVFLVVCFGFAELARYARHVVPAPTFSPRWGWYAPAGFLLLLCVLLIAATVGDIPLRVAPADSYFFSQSRVRSSTAVLWLGIRGLCSVILKVLLLVVLGLPFLMKIGLAKFWILLGVPMFLYAVRLPVYALSQRSRVLALVLSGCIVTVMGAYLRFRGAVEPLGIVMLYAGVVASTALGYLLLSDSYPELYARSRYRAGARPSCHSLRSYFSREKVIYAFQRMFSSYPVLGAHLWREVTRIARTGHRAIGWAAGLVFGVGFFAWLGLMLRNNSPWRAAAADIATVLLIVLPAFIPLTLPDDLGKPLWSISRGSWRARIFAWTLARSAGPSLILTPLTVSFWLSRWGVADLGAGLFLLWALCHYLYSSAVLAYSLLPSLGAQSLLALLFRTGINIVVWLMVALLGELAGELSGMATVGLLTAGLLIGLTSIIFDLISAARISGRPLEIVASAK